MAKTDRNRWLALQGVTVAKGIRLAVAVARMIGLAWRVRPGLFLGIITTTFAQGFTPLLSAWLTKVLFDLLASSAGIHATRGNVQIPRTLYVVVAAQALLLVISRVTTLVDQYLQTELEFHLSAKMQYNVYETISGFRGIAYFEDPAFHDSVLVVGNQAQHGPSQALRTLLSLMQNVLILISFLGVLLAFAPVLAVLLLVTAVPEFVAQIRFGRQRLQTIIHSSAKERRAAYYGQVLSGLTFAKEVRLFNLGNYFLQAFSRLTHDVHAVKRRERIHQLRGQLALDLFGNVVSSAALFVVVFQVFAGHLGLGDVFLYFNAVMTVQRTLLNLVISSSWLGESASFFQQYLSLLALPQPLPLPSHPQAVPPLHVGIQFDNVSFRYSEQDPWILRRVNLFIPAGRTVALVGVNGAGKTTVIKLLTRLYDPTEGRILWDGIDLRVFDPNDLRVRIAAIFQDFARFDLSVQENVGVGDICHLEETASVVTAARKANIHNRIMSLPQSYATILSRWLSEDQGGVDLSGGEWQRLGLARMFMRNADLMIMDEPSAALDAEAEHFLVSKFAHVLTESACLLITHRFSTARLAQAIAVLDGGEIVEYGTHEELLSLHGIYARLYQLQTTPYPVEVD